MFLKDFLQDMIFGATCPQHDARQWFRKGLNITGRSYRLKDHAAIPGKEDKNKKTKSKSNDPGFAEARPSTAEPAG